MNTKSHNLEPRPIVGCPTIFVYWFTRTPFSRHRHRLIKFNPSPPYPLAFPRADHASPDLAAPNRSPRLPTTPAEPDHASPYLSETCRTLHYPTCQAVPVHTLSDQAQRCLPFPATPLRSHPRLANPRSTSHIPPKEAPPVNNQRLSSSKKRLLKRRLQRLQSRSPYVHPTELDC